jgi:hypothetical protein
MGMSACEVLTPQNGRAMALLDAIREHIELPENIISLDLHIAVDEIVAFTAKCHAKSAKKKDKNASNP